MRIKWNLQICWKILYCRILVVCDVSGRSWWCQWWILDGICDVHWFSCRIGWCQCRSWLGRVFLNSNTKTAKIKLETPKFFTPSSPQLLLWHQFPEGLGVSSSNKNYQLPWYPIDWTWSGRQNLSCSGMSAPYYQFVNNVGNHWRSLDNVYLIIALLPSQWTLDASYSP